MRFRLFHTAGEILSRSHRNATIDLHLSVITYRAQMFGTTPKSEIYKDAAEKIRFRLKAANGEIIATAEACESKDGCRNGIESAKTNPMIAEIVDLTQSQ